jgi:hypothetical protein
VRKAALIAFPLALVAAGSCAFAAAGGGDARTGDVRAAKQRTAQASSIHYSVAVTMTKTQGPLVLHISGGSSREAMSVRLRLEDATMKDGTTMPGTDGAIMVSRPFLYERAPSGLSMFGSIRWLRVSIGGLPTRSQTLSTVRSLTPSPLLRVIGEARLHPVAGAGRFAGPVAYDDPIVRTALNGLGGGLEFRDLVVSVTVGRDGLIHRVGIDGRTADGKTSLRLRAHLYAYGVPVKLVPPKPGTFVDQRLEQLGA